MHGASRSDGGGRRFVDCVDPGVAVADHSPLSDSFFADFELRLDEQDGVEGLRGEIDERLDHLCERDEGKIGDEQVRFVLQVLRLSGRGCSCVR